ncbi:acyltransferase [Altibacter sp. HG106]|uniref:acyltransferase n=1 Tax=Altibacter sp. HG106 TaxID=3023937 RepID=UPI0023504849|nr:transferase [Altibacter sp. HG106]MDC7996132.1 transferase [Altibacter sp. HG106]
MEGIKAIYRTWKRKWNFFRKVNWIKTYQINYKLFPKKIARKLPVYIYGKVHFTSLSGRITIDAPIKKGMIGFGQPYELVTQSKGTAEIFLKGEFVCKGHVQFGKDYFLHVGEGAYFEMGHLASIASHGKVICKDRIVMGAYARMGSECQLIDTNFHQLYDTQTSERFAMTAPIRLGDYNFISNRVTIMRGTVTPNQCTIASNTLCTKDYTDLGEQILIGGIPAQLLKQHIARDWEAEQARLEKYLII